MYIRQNGWRNNAQNIVKRYLDEGLRDKAVTRDFNWGVHVPLEGYEDKRIFVWIEAVMGYLTASMKCIEGRNEDWREYWQGDDSRIYFVHGKDNIPFHTVIFPAILSGLGIKNPNLRIISSEYLKLEGKSFSSAKNWAIWADYIAKNYNIDSFRYYLALNSPEERDTDFTWRDYINVNNHDLASNLGVVELTIALHSVFNVPTDKIVWDVGHQTYVHKILTGRREQLKTIRKLDGLAGFPKTNESDCDCFNTGHSSTSISAALGMARARDLEGKNNSVIAVIGDGALTGGMALEALNDAGYSNTKMTVILNDNEMSISKNIGGLNMFLSKLRTKKLYAKSSLSAKKVIIKIPVVGKPFVKIVQRVKRSIKQLIIPKMFFEDIGFRYLGPVDGHNIEELERMLNISKQLEGPVLIHVLTKKGKGYKIAEENPDKFHATGPFEIETGKPKKEKAKDYSKVFGDKLVELAKKNEKIVAITASMKDGTGLTKFAKEFPDRFFDIGIAEQHALGLAAGMAKEGVIPVVPIYSSFYQRAYDQVIHDIAIQNLPVIMCVDRAGVVGADRRNTSRSSRYGVF